MVATDHGAQVWGLAHRRVQLSISNPFLMLIELFVGSARANLPLVLLLPGRQMCDARGGICSAPGMRPAAGG